MTMAPPGRGAAAGPSLPTPALVSLLTDLSLHALASSLHQTALFYAELLEAVQPNSEASVWLLALCHLRNGQIKATARILSQTFIHFPESESQAGPAGKGKGKARDVFAEGASGSLLGYMGPAGSVANLATVRCASLYAQACGQLGRPKEGQEVLRRVVDELGVPSAADLAIPAPTTSFSLSSLHCLAGNLALRSHDVSSAAKSFRAALLEPTGPLIWEAFDGLCKTGDPGASEHLFVDRIFSALGSSPPPAEATVPLTNGAAAAPVPPPPSSSLIYTPAEAGGTSLFAKGHQPPRKSAREPNLFAGGKALTMNMGEMSVDDSSLASFDQSYYAMGRNGRDAAAGRTLWKGLGPASGASKPAPPPPTEQSDLARNGPSSSTYATPLSTDVAPRPPPGVKRTRGGATNGVNAAKPVAMSIDASTRRSDRIRETGAVGRPIAGSIRVARGSQGTMGRDAKRARSGEPSSDVGEGTSPEVGFGAGRPLAPVPSSSPEIERVHSNGSGHPASTTARDDPERAAAVAWVANVVRRFAKATLALSRYDSQGVLDAVWGLPAEQKRTWRAYCLIARAKFEQLDYQAARIAFSAARVRAPYLTQSMDLYSTLLWHLRKPVELSCLAQELQAVDPHAAESWIATGNVFSLIDDHANALRCFKRATQLDESKAYAFTLSGHECVGLEESDRALGFFREAIRRDTRHYNAWFGMGDVYLKQGQLRIAEYHFRRAAELNPTNALLLCAIGNVLERRGKAKEAKELYDRGVELAPGAATVRFYRAKVLVSLKHYDQARTELVRLKDAEPTEFNVHFLLGKVFALTGDKASAARQLAYAQDLDPRAAARIRKVLEGGQDDVEEDASRDEPAEVHTRLDDTGEPHHA